MRSRRAHTVCVTNSPEVELQWEASVSPGDPGCRTLPNGDPGWPPSGPEVDDVRLVLDKTQIASARKLLGAFFALGDTTDARVEELVQDILERVLDAKVTPDDDEFREAAAQAGEPDPDEERDRREDR